MRMACVRPCRVSKGPAFGPAHPYDEALDWFPDFPFHSFPQLLPRSERQKKACAWPGTRARPLPQPSLAGDILADSSTRVRAASARCLGLTETSTVTAATTMASSTASSARHRIAKEEEEEEEETKTNKKSLTKNPPRERGRKGEEKVSQQMRELF
jgi:hypothetical protein